MFHPYNKYLIEYLHPCGLALFALWVGTKRTANIDMDCHSKYTVYLYLPSGRNTLHGSESIGVRKNVTYIRAVRIRPARRRKPRRCPQAPLRPIFTACKPLVIGKICGQIKGYRYDVSSYNRYYSIDFVTGTGGRVECVSLYYIFLIIYFRLLLFLHSNVF